MCALIVINNDGNFLKRLVAVEFVADRKNELVSRVVSALILELIIIIISGKRHSLLILFNNNKLLFIKRVFPVFI